MTSNTEKEGVVKGLEAGADDYLVKPFDSNEMLARIGVAGGSSICIVIWKARARTWKRWRGPTF